MSVGLAIGAGVALLVAVLTLASGTGLYAGWISIFGGAEGVDRSAAFAANVPAARHRRADRGAHVRGGAGVPCSCGAAARC